MKALISLAPDGRLLVEFPATETSFEHSILLQPIPSALKHLVSMLSYQDMGKGKLAQAGAPTQAIIDEWLKQEKQKADEALLALAKDVEI